MIPSILRRAMVLAMLVAAATSCTTLDRQRRQDREQFDQVRAAQQRADANPGDGRAAIEYADVVTRAWRSGAFVRCLQRRQRAAASDDGDDAEANCELDPEKQLEEASRLLEEAADAREKDAPALIAKKGLMYCAANNTDTCLRELRRSMSLQPNVLAGTGLATWHGNHENHREVRDVCEQTLPHLTGRQTRYQFMKLCLEKSGAESARSGLDWAPEEDREFFLDQHQRSQQAGQRDQSRSPRRRRRVQQCVAECEQQGNRCLRDCRTEQCETRCKNNYKACLSDCKAAAKE